MTPVSDGAESHSHFLDDETDRKREDDKGNEKADAETGTRGGVRKHARGIVLTEKDEDAGANEKPEKADASQPIRSGALPASTRHTPAISRAIHILMSQKADQVAGNGRGSG